MSLQKLVRDKIPDLIRARGAEPLTRVLSVEEFRDALLDKFSEELDEFARDPSAEELADVCEVLRGLSDCFGIPFEHVEQARKQKYESRGGFQQRIFLEGIREP